jgi:hypothetical protein
VPYENRFTVQLSKQFEDAVAVSLGARLIDYPTAISLGGVGGVSF